MSTIEELQAKVKSLQNFARISQQEAENFNEQMLGLRDEVDDLHAQLEAARNSGGGGGSSDPAVLQNLGKALSALNCLQNHMPATPGGFSGAYGQRRRKRRV